MGKIKRQILVTCKICLLPFFLWRHILFVLQIVEVNLQRAGGYDQLTDREAERGDQEQQGDSEDDDRCDPKADEAEKHRHDTAEQT